MAQPTPYEREYNFTNYQASSPSAPLPASHVDAELNRVKTTLDEVLANLELIQRDDGELANGVVGLEQMDAAAVAGVNIATLWVTATAYAVGDIVIESTTFYYCAVAHTSGTFATDLTAGKWVSLGSVGAVTSVFGRTGNVTAVAEDYDASEIEFTPAGSIAATDVQAAIEELDSETAAALALLQPLDAELTLLASLDETTNNIIQSVSSAWASRTPTQFMATVLTGASNDDIIQRKAGVWTNRTMAQLAADLPTGSKASFKANKNGSNQTISAATPVKVTATTEVYDVGSYYDASNSRWTPPAGKVLVTARLLVSSVVPDTVMILRLYKNGSNTENSYTNVGAGGNASLQIVVQDNASGTDYYEIYVDSDGADSSYTVSGGATTTSFEGSML